MTEESVYSAKYEHAHYIKKKIYLFGDATYTNFSLIKKKSYKPVDIFIPQERVKS